jgi:hypothetical protein
MFVQELHQHVTAEETQTQQVRETIKNIFLKKKKKKKNQVEKE